MLQNNKAIGTPFFIEFGGNELQLINNLATNNDAVVRGGFGFQIRGQNMLVKGNTAIGNDVGFLLDANGHTAITRNNAIGNRGPGIIVLTSAPQNLEIHENNIYGNDVEGTETDVFNPPHQGRNCGLIRSINSDAPLDVTNNYWGSSKGPVPIPLIMQALKLGASPPPAISFSSPSQRRHFLLRHNWCRVEWMSGRVSV